MSQYRIPAHRPIRTRTVHKATRKSEQWLLVVNSFTTAASIQVLTALWLDSWHPVRVFFAGFFTLVALVALLKWVRARQKVLVQEE